MSQLSHSTDVPESAMPPAVAPEAPLAASTSAESNQSIAWWQQHWAALALIALTLFAGTIRFFRLSSPCLWYDEARVYYRICGSYQQMLDCLRTDGFGPLHYQSYFLLVQSLTIPSMVAKWHWVEVLFPSLNRAVFQSSFPGPFAMRFIPALCGTLMVPVMYFLARQLLPLRTSLLAAAFTASSAFLIFYSRDAKMYMDTWLFVTLGMACLFWWFRTNQSTAWLCWIASSAISCGIHATALIALPLSLLFLLSQKTLRWQKVVLWVVGVAIITAGPVGYYETFNTWKDRASEDWHDSGLEWIPIYNFGRTGPEMSRYLGSTMLMGWEWPKEDTIRALPPARVDVPMVLVTAMAISLVAAIFPWPHRWRGNRAIEPLPQPRWRSTLWISLWIAVPTYGFYCRSMKGFASPVDWFRWLVDQLPTEIVELLRDHQWPWAVIGIVLGAGVIAATRRDWTRSLLLRGVEMLALFAAVLAVLGVIYAACVPAARAAAAAGNPWESIWVPRYIGVIWPAIALAVAALIMRLPTLPVRATAIALLLATNLIYGGTRIFAQTEPPVDTMAADVFAAKKPANRMLTWTNLHQGRTEPGGGNLLGECGEYYMQSLERLPMSPVLFKQETARRKRFGTMQPSLPLERDIPANVQNLIVWNEYAIAEPPSKYERPMIGWTLRSDVKYTVRDFWIWQDLARYRRREYVRNISRTPPAR